MPQPRRLDGGRGGRESRQEGDNGGLAVSAGTVAGTREEHLCRFSGEYARHTDQGPGTAMICQAET